ncbi:hypothetical protein PF005_g6236 [Phytophthora fragariae]|nr:hypothetical protein PF003_g24039 [Phytophthora fragariae]KAE9020667.1 hypothetical protein PF011_g5302 [Phytophthora fragariae]KAE9125296.1 hypothetical protein PF010_g5678 [Phytophthora fragariae]KAE9127519.1 hypothetical protein PF007_g5589 [Phytophthora fragariae]KAE9223612.1 hypothetical protein PF005_g6236 [Phytophthora fragariae]
MTEEIDKADIQMVRNTRAARVEKQADGKLTFVVTITGEEHKASDFDGILYTVGQELCTNELDLADLRVKLTKSAAARQNDR